MVQVLHLERCALVLKAFIRNIVHAARHRYLRLHTYMIVCGAHVDLIRIF
jgi:hypothetical protein